MLFQNLYLLVASVNVLLVRGLLLILHLELGLSGRWEIVRMQLFLKV